MNVHEGVKVFADYEEFVAPYSARILASVDAPTIHFGTGTAHLLEAMARAGGDVIGLDWRVRLDESWQRVGFDRGVQGNLDPALLLGPFERTRESALAILESVDVPSIHFGTGTAHLLEAMTAAGGDVIGLDWRLPIDEAWERIGFDRGVQGNLDPALLLGPFERVREVAVGILEAVGGRPGHIFNLGHGVLPETNPADLRRLVELVHEQTARAVA